MTALPEALRQRVEALSAFPGSLLVSLPEGAVALGLRRPTGSLMRLAVFWLDPAAADRAALGRRLAEAFRDQARAAGALVLRASPAEADALEPEAFSLLGLPAFGEAPYVERWLDNAPPVLERLLPLYAQTTRFTCGPASLMMAMQALDGRAPDRREEIALWREATTLITQTGPGGCDPHGLALAARARGFAPRILSSTDRAMLTERVETDDRRELITFVQEDLQARTAAAGIPFELRRFEVAEIAALLDRGGLALLLVSQFPTHGRHTPHWIVAHHHQDGVFLVNDPWPDPPRGETAADAEHLPIRAQALESMCWFGDPAYRAAVLLERPLVRQTAAA